MHPKPTGATKPCGHSDEGGQRDLWSLFYFVYGIASPRNDGYLLCTREGHTLPIFVY
jgi:hypothetical protein